MPRYIDVYALKEALLNPVTNELSRITWGDIDNAPTVDAEPVRHGYWIDGWICSECGEAFNTNGEAWNYCPNCGAMMNEVTDETNK